VVDNGYPANHHLISEQSGQNMLYSWPQYALNHMLACDLTHKMAVAATLWFLNARDLVG
jgi:hypothetical protein